MKISIITPSFRNSAWLKLCIASVADQEGVEVEHIVQDAGSDDGTLEWLPTDPRVKAFIEKDSGMYDAINRGFQRATGDIIAWLNCDEQYLPGALASVHDYFEAHPETDVLVADSIVTDAKGNYLCHRMGLDPIQSHLWVRFPVLSCSLFVRRRVVSEMGIFLDAKWRIFGDLFWVMDFKKNGLRFGTLRQFLSTFADTGENLALSPRAQEEAKVKEALIPRWVLLARPAIILWNKFRLLLSGAYTQKPFDFALYTLAAPSSRTLHQANLPTGHWPGRR
ncbi:MAG: glycosyltransferase family 2 protein [Verrucomicrobiota bacterium]